MTVYGLPDRSSYDRMARAVKAVNSRLPKTVGPMRVKEPNYAPPIAAIADGDISAGATVNVLLADSSFVATTDTKEATNDSGQTIPSGTKLYICRVRPLPGMRIIWAAICED